MKSPEDKNSYKLYKLSNKITLFAVQNKDFTHSSLGLSVRVGSYEDPVGLEGLAHEVQHCILSGSSHSKNLNAIYDFLINNHGSLNSWTGKINTFYTFRIINQNFEQAAEIFAGLFVHP